MRWTTLESLKRNRNTIMTSNLDVCFICGAYAEEAHHVLHGADKALSEEYQLILPLCRKCHYDIHHGSGEYDLKLKQEAQRALLRQLLGRCYL